MGGLIFDFDGVIADSEALANIVLADLVSDLGSPTTLDDAFDRYSGRRWKDAMAEIERHLGGPLPGGFSDRLQAATLDRFRTDLKEVSGASAFIRKFGDIPSCIASSSSPGRLRLCLSILGLEDAFGGRVFSAEEVPRGKPHPDIFLFAADRLGVPAEGCLVIEDSVSGILGAVSAGMATVGLCAASHIRAGHDLKLLEAGAAYLASSWSEVDEIASDFFGRA